jgi:hypothetical protein
MSLSWGVSNNKQLNIERATQKWKGTVVGIEEEIKVIFEGDGAVEHVDSMFLMPFESCLLIFFRCAMNDREGEEMSRKVYEMIYARLHPKRIIDEFGETQADYMRSLRL